jgi:hypothetical protein
VTTGQKGCSGQLFAQRDEHATPSEAIHINTPIHKLLGSAGVPVAREHLIASNGTEAFQTACKHEYTKVSLGSRRRIHSIHP